MDKPSAAIILGGLRKFKEEFGDTIFDYGDIGCTDLMRMMIESNKKRYTNRRPIDAVIMASTLAYGLNKWRYNKKIYRFDNNFLKSLYTSKFSDLPMPFKTIIDKLEDGIFIENKDNSMIGYVYNIIHENDGKYLAAVPISNLISRRIATLKPIVVRIDSKSTIQDALESMVSDINSAARDIGSSRHFTIDDEKEQFIRCITPLIYILSNNADIEQDPDNMDTFEGIDKAYITDKFGEVQIFNVGFNIAKDIQAMDEILRDLKAEGDNNVGVRSGHWRSRISASGVATLHYISPTLWSKNKERPIETETESEKELRFMVESLQKELDSKTQYITELEQKCSSLEAKYRALEVGFNLRDKELSYLRDALFNKNTDSGEETFNTSIKFPWYTDKKITVFGGHPSWVNKIKPMLPNIRFVDRTAQSTNPNLIKSSDMIWLQTNAMSHSLYNSIIDIVRQYNKPVRYFSYASSEKCAIQLVEEMCK